MTRVDGLLSRVEQQLMETTRDELHAVRVALKALLSVAQARAIRRPPFDGSPV